MGYIPSAETVYAVAYLTETGRDYLFNKTNNRFDSNGDDLFKITKFSLSDSDTNYEVDQSANSPYRLSSGDVPDATGNKDSSCLKTASNYSQSSLVAFVFDSTPTSVEYNADLDGDPPTLTISEEDIPGISPGETPPPLGTVSGGGSGPATSGPAVFSPQLNN